MKIASWGQQFNKLFQFFIALYNEIKIKPEVKEISIIDKNGLAKSERNSLNGLIKNEIDPKQNEMI